MNVAVISLIYFIFSRVDQGQSKAALQNGTMRYYIYPMENWEAEALQRQSRQQQASPPSPPSNTGNPNPDDGTLPIASTAVNVVNILNGLLNADVRPILVGGTAFIPGGQLREGVQALVLGLAPNIQQLLFGTNHLPPSYSTVVTRQPPQPPPPYPYPQRPQLIRATTNIPQSPVTLPVVLAQTPPPTLAPTPKDLSEEASQTDTPLTAPPLPPPTSTRPSTTTSAESEEEPEDPVAILSTSTPISVTFDPEPETERIPELSTSAIVPPPQPQQATPTPKPAPTVAQLKVVLEDRDSASIITVNSMASNTTESKQYFYLVLLPEEYDHLTQLEAMSKTPKPQRHLEAERGIQEETEILSPSTTTIRTSRLRNRNRIRTTTIIPPHLQLNYYYQMTTTPISTTTTTTTTSKPSSSTDLPGVQGFQNEDDEFEQKITIH